MRVLLDEQMDWRLGRLFDAEHTVETVRALGWEGKRNGVLLRDAATAFDVLLTMDRGIEYQQHFPRFDIAIVLVVARSNRRQEIEPVMPEINRLLPHVRPGRLYRVSA